MQYQKFLEKSKNVDVGSYPLNFHSYFEGDLFSTDLESKFPPGNPYSESGTPVSDRRSRYRRRVIEQLAGLRVPGKDHLKRYLLRKFRNNCKQNTIRNAHISIVKFLKFIQSHNQHELESVKRSSIETFVEYEQDRGMAAGTLCTRLICLYAFIRFLVDDGVLDRELLKRKIIIKQPKRLPKSIEPDDEDRILTQIDNVRDNALIRLLLRTGMRISELLNTQMEDISLEGQVIRIYESDKTSIGRVVYFSNDAAEALYHWLMKRDYWKKYLFHNRRDQAISYTAAWSIFKKYVDKAGLSHKGITLHCLRHTYATNLLNAGIPIEVLRDLLGHQNLEHTRRYARLTDRTRKEEYFKTMAIIEGKKNR
ncbi:MAG: tyrosine-type recombinase/integrase [Deltaproteobacteria bacterium]|nr:tyrosine-type recombinase/integrase [Deltaproteobacteria bacterium]